MPLNLSFEIAEDDEGIFISKAAAVWQGAIPKRAMVPLPARARAMHAGTSYVHGRAVVPPVDPISCDGNTSHHMQICTDEVAQDASDVFQSISATPGLRSWSFEVRRLFSSMLLTSLTYSSRNSVQNAIRNLVLLLALLLEQSLLARRPG